MSYTVILPTEYGQMLVNRHDINQTQHLLQTGRAIDHHDIEQVCKFVEPGSNAIDAGACFGAWTLAFAKKAERVYSFEAQRRLFQQVCGTLALNGIENVYAHNVALGDSRGAIGVPKYDYNKALQFGCVYLCQRDKHGEMLQDERDAIRSMEDVLRARIDGYDLPNVSVIKIDVEGMEVEVLRGAKDTIKRCRPVLYVETLLTGQPAIEQELAGLNYYFINTGMDVLCVPTDKWDVDPGSAALRITRRKS